ncbi:unnamed protein product [Lactuca virosa]|uniref:Uncharacterized protein n=1 Tax=Lactuca virosa TaxID=75947 RepID=A0AAU9MLW4_9ASTR|nr:unnamed protein product [Lactuca virosa]
MSQCLHRLHLTLATSHTSSAPPSVSTKDAIDPLEVHLFRHRCPPPPLSPRFYLLIIRVALTLSRRHIQPLSGRRRYNLLAGHRPPFRSILSKPQRSDGINKSWLLLKLQHQTISAPIFVGQLVGQLAKLHGCYVVGSAGTTQKADYQFFYKLFPYLPKKLQVQPWMNSQKKRGGSLRGQGWKYGSGFVDGIFPVLSPDVQHILNFMKKETDVNRVWDALSSLVPTHTTWDDIISVGVQFRLNNRWDPIILILK